MGEKGKLMAGWLVSMFASGVFMTGFLAKNSEALKASTILNVLPFLWMIIMGMSCILIAVQDDK